MKEKTLTSKIFLKINGSEVQRSVMQNLLEATVDQHSHLPAMFTLRFNDLTLELLDEGPFDLTKEIEILAAKPDGDKVSLIKGEITALEPEFEEGMIAELVVRGYDKSHRLYREIKSRAYLNVKDSDLATEIARAVNLQPEVDTTSAVYEHIFQHNQSDLAFLRQRAWRIGYECFVDNGKLYFRKPSTASAQITLQWGQDLLSFRPRMSLAEQVDEVLVKGWDVDKQEAIVGQAENGHLFAKVEKSEETADRAADFGAGKLVLVDQAVVSQAEADTLAAARMDEVSGAFVEAEGVAFRRPDIKAGQMITIKALGQRFSGDYLVTNASHVYTAEGLRTTFSVRGARTGLLLEQITREPAGDGWPGGVIGIVTNTDDPNDWGRIKVKFPWLSDEAESDWARVVGLGAGPEAGVFLMPDVDDEVLVVFGHGDFSRPFVIGGLWNGQHKLPAEAAGAGSGEKPQVRTWHSRSGHWLAMYDNADNKVEIVTAGGHKMTLDDANSKISLESSGGLKLNLDDSGSKITLESGSEVQIKAGSNLTIEASGNLDLKASGQLNIKGAMVNLN